ncbi:hypothetical protein ILUMI_23812 [Ignelater luminosus]|uniref:Uncharacterized protein n=1 Tax=Ignelater luminosus TaxID=2038154 RepID=A0A8K0CEN1_IGNLU|nr:hypothetical protein ILUMI_23812 [Ignelater luminosus]
MLVSNSISAASTLEADCCYLFGIKTDFKMDNFIVSSIINSTKSIHRKDDLNSKQFHDLEDITSPTPIKQRYYQMSPPMLDIVNKERNIILELRVIRSSSSPWNSRFDLVKKKKLVSMSQFSFVIQHRKGKFNTVPDTLFRAPVVQLHRFLIIWRRRLLSLVQGNDSKAYERNERQYNLGKRSLRFRKGDIVWQRNPVVSDASKGFAKKLPPKYVKAKHGPCYLPSCWSSRQKFSLPNNFNDSIKDDVLIEVHYNSRKSTSEESEASPIKVENSGSGYKPSESKSSEAKKQVYKNQ